MPITTVFSQNVNGAITFTGNSLGLSKALNSQDIGTASSIGAYITTNTSDIVPTYPNGTTLSYTSNSSSAKLTIPEGSTILHAELIWGGTCQVQHEDHISETLNATIQFIIPTTPPQSITIDKSKLDGRRLEVSDDGSCTFYTNWANVTEYVSRSMSGIYVLSGAIGTNQQDNNSYNSCGWTLAVCYENQSLPSRYISLYSNIQPIAPNSTFDLNLSNFKTPLSRSAKGRILLSALRGSAVDTGDQVLFGSTISDLTPLSGPRNMVDNFFGSQINNDLGELDSFGTFGDRNQDIINTTNVPGGRQSQDITNVDASNKLSNNQTSAVLQFKASAREYFVNGIATQIDIATPLFSNLNITANKNIVSIGDIVEYTIYVKNSGDVDAKNVTLTDTLPSGFSYNSNTLIVNDTSTAGDPTAGVSLGPINIGQTIPVKFKATVNGPAHSNSKYINSVKIDYSFDVPNNTITSGTIDTINRSDTTTDVIYSSNISIIPTISISDKSSNAIEHVVAVGNTVQYTISVKNTSLTESINSVTLNDTLPDGLSYVNDSLTIDGTDSTDPITNINLNTIAPNTASTIKFTANVNSNPTTGDKYTNSATLSYTFKSPDNTDLSSSVSSTNNIYSNSVVITPTISISDKSSNTIEHVVAVGNTVQYTISVKNTSLTESIESVTLNDTLPDGLSYVANSLTIDDIDSKDPITAINLNTIAPNTTSTIKFTANVNSNPTTGNKYSNSATLSYTFKSPDNTDLSSSVSSTNSIYSNSIVITPTISISDKSSNAIEHVVAVGNTVQYTISVKNTSLTESINSVTLNDTLPDGFSYVNDSLTIDGTDSTDPITAINLNTIAPNTASTIKFTANVNSNPTTGDKYTNSATLSYTFKSPDNTDLSSSVSSTNSIYSNSVIITPTISISDKSSNAIEHVVAVGNTVQYTISVKNTSLTESINSVTLNDTLPDGLSYVNDSLTIDGTDSTDPITAINLNTVAPNTTSTIKFTANVNSNPTTGNKYSNSATLSYTFKSPDNTDLSSSVSATNNIYSDSIVITPNINISANPNIVNINDIVIYSITISNDTSTIIENPVLTDTLPSGLTYKANSLTVNGTESTNSLETGVTLPNIDLTNPVTVEFKATVVSTPSLGIEYINNVNLDYDFNSIAGTLSNKISANNTIHSNAIIIKPNIILNSSKRSVSIGDYVKFTLLVENNNSTIIENPIVTFKISNGLAFIPNSLNINGSNSSESIKNDISLANISPNKTSTVIFQCSVNSLPPDGIQYLSLATIKYNFQSPGGELTNILNSNNNIIFINSTIINPLIFKHITYITPKNNPLIENIDMLNLTSSPITYSLNTYPLNGYASISENGTLIYTPKIDFIGKDTFSLLLSNKKLGSITSTITVIIKSSSDFKYNLC